MRTVSVKATLDEILLTLTMVEALRSNRDRLARHYLAERSVHRPSSALGWRLSARATH